MANNNVTVLNGKTATAVALVLFIFGSRAIQGIFYNTVIIVLHYSNRIYTYLVSILLILNTKTCCTIFH